MIHALCGSEGLKLEPFLNTSIFLYVADPQTEYSFFYMIRAETNLISVLRKHRTDTFSHMSYGGIFIVIITADTLDIS